MSKTARFAAKLTFSVARRRSLLSSFLLKQPTQSSACVLRMHSLSRMVHLAT